MLELARIDGTFKDFDAVKALSKEAFPKEEYLDPALLVAMAEEKNFDFWALMDQGRFIGYMAVLLKDSLAYLFFLAIQKDARGEGYGSEALSLFRKRYSGDSLSVDLEAEEPSSPNAEQRRRRRAFYLKNGFHPTGEYLSYLGVDYEILSGSEDFSLSAFQSCLRQIAIADFDPHYYRK